MQSLSSPRVMRMATDEPGSGAAFPETVKRELDADLVGVANVREEGKHFHGLPEAIAVELPYAIVVGRRVSPTVLGTLDDRPNLIYFHHYRQLNRQLDESAQRIAAAVERLGYHALPIPASQIVDWGEMLGHVSHKKLAWLAGLGWRGRNNLLVTEAWGAQVRLASILTDLPLTPASPTDSDCGICRRCLDACPAQAIKNDPQDFDQLACLGKLKEFSRMRGIGQYVCGLCVKACHGCKGETIGGG